MTDQLKNTFKLEKSNTKGIVLDTTDPEGKNRIKVYIPTHRDILDVYQGTWCTCALLTKPDEDDIVVVSYENDDHRVPMITSNITKAMSFDPSTYGNGGGTISNEALIDLIAEILSDNEGKYDTVVANDHGSLSDYGGVSVGRLGWHENNARDDIFKVIKETCQADWDKGPGSSLRSLNQTWVHYIPDSTDVSIMKTILTTDTGKATQDNIILEYIKGYLEDAGKLGITDTKCLIYYCDFANQGSDAAKKCAKWCGSENLNDLNKFHNKILSGTDWPADTTANRNRRTKTKNAILEMESSGRLAATEVSGSTNGQLLWPFPGFPKISYPFGYSSNYYDGTKYHCGVDINSDGNTKGVSDCHNQPVVACCDGSAWKGTESSGNNYVEIHTTLTNGTDLYCHYYHLDHFDSSISKATSEGSVAVKVGQTIGYAGNTGYADGYHLHFELRLGGDNDGSRSESDHGNCVDPEPYMLPDGVSVSSGSGSTVVSKNGEKVNLGKYKVIQKKENCPYLAPTDIDWTQINQLVPFVNPDVSVGSKYIPPLISDPGLFVLSSQEDILLQPIVWTKFHEMRASFISENPGLGKYFKIKNGYRSFDDQMKKYQKMVARDEERKKIVPAETDEYKSRTSTAGHSEHQLGLAIDLYSDDYRDWTGDSALQTVSQWLYNNAYKYGFIVRYSKDNEIITGYKEKPYHLRYVGKDVAQFLFAQYGAYSSLEWALCYIV